MDIAFEKEVHEAKQLLHDHGYDVDRFHFRRAADRLEGYDEGEYVVTVWRYGERESAPYQDGVLPSWVLVFEIDLKFGRFGAPDRQ
jgi:hypothetical protein